MWKKVCKNVILALCVLALVFQPVSIFASDNLNYTTFTEFQYAVRQYLGYPPVFFYPRVHVFPDEGSEPEDILSMMLYFANDYIGDPNYIYYAFCYPSDDKYNCRLIAAPYGQSVVYRVDLGNVVLRWGGNGTVYQVVANKIPTSGYTLDLADAFDNMTTTTASSTIIINNMRTYKTEVSLPSIFGPYYLLTSKNAVGSNLNYDVKFNLVNSDSYDPSLPLDNVLPPTSPDVNNEMFYWWLNSNFFYRDGQSALNQSYIPVGRYLTYHMLCMDNPDLNSITIDGIDFHNWYYDLAQSLAMIISSMPSSQTLNEIADRLETAFPDDQADMNDAIAETLLDNSGGTGLTIDKIQTAKSSFNDAVAVYYIPSNTDALSSITDGDWSFWSQTTVNNLGAGYSFDDAQLMSENEEDILVTNQRSLLQMLGW